MKNAKAGRPLHILLSAFNLLVYTLANLIQLCLPYSSPQTKDNQMTVLKAFPSPALLFSEQGLGARMGSRDRSERGGFLAVDFEKPVP